MTERWMLGALAAGALLGLAARVVEPVAGWFGLPRRWIWAAAMAGSLLLPATALAFPGALPHLRLPSWAPRLRPSAPPPPDGAAPAPASRDGLVAASPGPQPLSRAVLAAWLAASLATLTTFAWTRRRLRAACGPCVPRRIAGTRVMVSTRAGPMVLGLLDPEIVLPRWALDAEDESRVIVRHEREHVRAGDPWLLAAAALAVAALPWSLVLWWQHRRLRLAVETDCDARVLAAGESRRHYGQVLLRTASHPLFIPAPSLAWADPSSHLERRILAMTARTPRHRVLRAVPLAACACAVTAAACGVAAADGRREPTSPMGDRSPRIEVADGRLMRTDRLAGGTYLTVMGPVPGQGTFGLAYAFGSTPRTRTSPPPTQLPTVRRVKPGSPAARAGVREGDVIVSVNGRDGRAPFLFPDRSPGAAYAVRLRRGGAERDVRLVTGPPPSRAEAERHMALEAACSRRERAPSTGCMIPY
jgi:hypothetical protein